jgi:ATP-dependent DNA helicase RecG
MDIDLGKIVNVEVTKKVKERLLKILLVVQKRPGIKLPDLITDFPISERTLKENIEILLEVDLLNYRGSRKTGGYFLSDRSKKKLASVKPI